MLTNVHTKINDLRASIDEVTATVAVCGMGYVGAPLAVAAANAGYSVIGFDIDSNKTRLLNEGNSYIDAVSGENLRRLIAAKKFRASSDFSTLSACDIIIVCVPTPLSRQREPDLSYVFATSETIAAHLRPGQMVVIESTTYPGTTDEVVKPILERTGMRSGVDFLLGFSPEREDPGNKQFGVKSIPKVVSGDGEVAKQFVGLFYGAFVERVVPVSTTQTAEAVKITENVFRAVNIALVNELKVIYGAMGIDVWEVIEAAKTKPFGYMPFYPGPGLGGHCIPIDPFYLTWKSREYGLTTRFIELAGQINVAMPHYVIERLSLALNEKLGLAPAQSRILVVGLAYKKNVADIRESPSLRLMEILEERHAQVDYCDPFVPVIPPTREHARLAGRHAVTIDAKTLGSYHVVLLATDHDDIDYRLIAEQAQLIIDTRNVFERLGLANERVLKA